MKKFILTALILSGVSAAFAQSEQTIFSRAKVVGGFGGPVFTYSKIGDEWVTGAGGGGGIVFRNIFVGGFGHGEFNDIRSITNDNYRLALGYGGLWLGFTVPTSKALHFYGSAKLGVGGVDVYHRFWDPGDFEGFDNTVIVAVPEAGIELNLTHWFRISGTVGYRWVDGYDGTAEVDQKGLNQPIYGITLRFGWFGHRNAPPKENTSEND